MNLFKKKELKQKRRWRIRKKVKGTANRPRVAVCFTNKNIHVQCIDDENGHTVIAASTNEKQFKELLPNVNGSQMLSKAFGERLVEKGVKTIVFDRSGRKYHGCVKAFAESLRDLQIKF